MDDESATSDLEVWDRLLSQQTDLFRRTANRNQELENRVEELERELGVWKAALKAADDEKRQLNRAVLKLERSIGSLKDDNPLILCLIDGDGNIFSSDLICLGQAGGHQAAMLLTKGLNDHMANMDSEVVSGRGQVWLTVYCNKTGLLETLTSNNICTAEQFEAFVMGFNQASPLFSFVDVGIGKERADEKIKECLRVFTRFPQTIRVFFGGAHDNGYISTLNYLQNEGLLHKLTILHGYRDLAFELKSLELPCVQIDGLFMTKKLQTNNNKKNATSNSSHVIVQPQDFDKFRPKQTPQPPKRRETPVKTMTTLDNDLPLHKHRPPPCNFFYLAECMHGNKCRYGHNYNLLPEHIEELRSNSKKWPCPFANRGRPCPYGDSCCMGHFCPKGLKCSFLKLGKCKFTADHMHSVKPYSAHTDSRSSTSSVPSTSPAATMFSTVLPSSALNSPSRSAYDDLPGTAGRSSYTTLNNAQSLLALLDLGYDEHSGWSNQEYGS